MIRSINVLVVLFLYTFPALSQLPVINFINYTQSEGLPSNESYYAFRDSKNYIWITTDQGVVRYNGKEMKRFELPDNVVFKIREDKKGRIWFFSQTGKLCFLLNDKIVPYQYNANIQEKIKTISIINAIILDDDALLLESYNGENYRITSKGEIVKLPYNISNQDSLVFTINEPKINNVFAQKVLSNSGLLDTLIIYDHTHKINEVYKIPFHQRSSAYYGVVKNKHGETYFYNSNCLIKLLENGKYIVKKFPFYILDVKDINGDHLLVGLLKGGGYSLDNNLAKAEEIGFLKSKSVTSINSDFEKGIWFTTLENGAFYLPKSSIYNFLPSLSQTNVLRLAAVDDSILLIAKNDGLYKYEKSKLVKIYSEKFQSVTDLFVDKMSNIWISGAYYHIFPPLSFGEKIPLHIIPFKNIFSIQSSSEITHIVNDKYFFNQGNEFISINPYKDYGDQRFLKGSSQISLVPGKIFATTKGEIFIATINNFYKLNQSDNSVQPVFQKNSLFASGITCIRQFNDSIIAIGVRFGGVILIKDTTIIAKITEKNGLINNSVKYLLPLKNELWIATASGISAVTFKNSNYTNYTISNIGKSLGLSNLLIYQLLPFKNNILAATNDGIIQIKNPDSLIKRTPIYLPFYINSISYFKKDTTELSYISLPFEKGRIEIKYNAISFISPKDIKYYYRFAGNDSIWNETSGNELIFENLSPGNYLLQLKASIIKDQRFSDIHTINIVINKPWWQNNWLRFFAILLFLLLLFIFYKWRMANIRSADYKKAEIRLKMAELEQAALRSQMNPHFIFNCLTSIQQLIIFEKNYEANEYLVQFSNLIRATLENSSRSFISIQEEEDYLSKYLLLEQMRIPGQFNFQFIHDKDIDIEKIEIPSMILQPLIENSIRHGLKGLTDRKGIIVIKFEKAKDFINCTISDNGKGADSGIFISTKRFGIRNVIQRLELLSDNASNSPIFNIQNQKDSNENIIGTIVRLKMPFQEK